MKSKIKILMYWFSLVLPVIDVIKGTIAGLRNVWNSVHTEAEKKRAEQIYNEMKEKFENDNI